MPLSPGLRVGNADELFSKPQELQYPVFGPKKIMACTDFAHWYEVFTRIKR